METNNKEDEAYKKHIDKLVKPIFDKVLKEMGMDTMSGVKPISFLWRPNNYRLQIPFKTETFKRDTTIKSGVKISNYGTKFTLKNFHEATIMLDIPKKKSAKITIIYHPLKKFYYHIESESIKGIGERIFQRVNEIEYKLISAVGEFTKLVGGEAAINKREWKRHEDEVKHEEFIDSLPPDLVIHDTYFKKVYQKGLEFKSPVIVKNYISARVIEDIAPEIAKEINLFNMKIDKVATSMAYVAENYKSHVKMVEQGTKVNEESLKLFKKLNRRLSQKKLKEYF